MVEFIELFKVIILGIVEGITEWLPISSTGHMLLVDEFIALKASEEFMDMFLVVVQLGAILAVVLLFFRKLWPFAKGEKYLLKKDTWNLWLKIFAACLPTIAISVFADKIDALFMNAATVTITLILYGILFILIENKQAGAKAVMTDTASITYKTAICIGLFQVLAVIPGTSRSGATIIGALLLGVSRYAAAEFTFFLAVPVMFGASFLKLLQFGFHFTEAEAVLLAAGMLTAFLVSLIVIRFLMNFIQKHDFKIFGWYRIILGVIIGGYFLF